MANIEAGEWVQVAIIMFVDSKFGGSFLRYPERFRWSSQLHFEMVGAEEKKVL